MLMCCIFIIYFSILSSINFADNPLNKNIHTHNHIKNKLKKQSLVMAYLKKTYLVQKTLYNVSYDINPRTAKKEM